MPPMKSHVVVVGGGTMGSGIAMVFCAAGWKVSVVDPAEGARQTLLDRMAQSLERLGAPYDLSHVVVAESLGDVDWRDVGLVMESAAEDLAVKQQCFRDIVSLGSPAITLATNSTGYTIQQIAEGLATQQRMLGVHFLMPAQFVPLVEIIPGPQTSPEIVDAMRNVLHSLGKRPVVLKQPLIGFLANRMQAALMREACSLIDRGVATPEDVDAAVRYSFGFRYAAAGPIMQKEHGGWDISYSLYEKVFPDLCNDVAPCPTLRKMMAERRYGMKTGRGFFVWDDADKMNAERTRFETALRSALDVLAI
jgi:3-hydroxybutyryl-CoA dehydrogenase